MTRLQGRVAVVTGSGRGIGRGIALGFAAEGADVMVNDLDNVGEAEAVADEIRAMGRRADVFIADAGDGDQVRSLVEAVVARFGRLDVAVANAVYERHAPFLDARFEDVQST